MGRGKPFLPNLKDLIAAGIDPNTGLPLKIVNGDPTKLDLNIKKLLRVIDEQDAVNRYTWTGIEMLDLTSQDIERLLYYNGQLAFFYFKDIGKFYFMPYALKGTIDFYGRYNVINPVPFASGVDGDEKAQKENKARYDRQASLLSQLSLYVKYGVVEDDKVDKDTLENSCVLLYDYTRQRSENNIPRQMLNEPLLHVMAETIPFMRTSLLAGSGIKAMRVNDADQKNDVVEANKSIENAAKSGEIMIPVVNALEMQELTNGQPIKSEEYMLALQSLDNFRKSTYGIENGGLFEKKAHELESENEMNMGASMNQFQDGLACRQNFCNIVNSIWHLGIWCEPSSNITMQDMETDDDSESLNNQSENEPEMNEMEDEE